MTFISTFLNRDRFSKKKINYLELLERLKSDIFFFSIVMYIKYKDKYLALKRFLRLNKILKPKMKMDIK